MPSWWSKSSKETKKKANRESFIDTLQRKFKSTSSDSKSAIKPGGSQRRSDNIVSRSTSPSKNVQRCQSFADRPLAQPLPLPGLHSARVVRTESGIISSSRTKAKVEKGSKASIFRPIPRPGCIRSRLDPADAEGELAVASMSSGCSVESDDMTDSRQPSPLASDYEFGSKTATGSPSSVHVKDQSPIGQISLREQAGPVNLSTGRNVPSSSPKRRPLSSHVPNIQVPCHNAAFWSAPDSSMSSPSRSPMRVIGAEQAPYSTIWAAGRTYPDLHLLGGSACCSSPGSGQNSGQNSMGGDMSGQLFWQPSRGSPEYSPNPSPRMRSPGPSSRVQSGAVTPIHPRAGGGLSESQTGRNDDGKQQSHPLPLPPLAVSNSSHFSHSSSAAASPSVPRSPGRAETLTSPGSRWKKGKLLGRGTFGHVYVGFNSDNGEMCAMKEVTLFSDDAKSKESAKQLAQEISLLSRLRHPNIVQYYGSEMVGDKLYIYLEYVSGGSIYKLLQDYGAFGETAIRSYTQQILSGLAYLHAKNTLHRDIKGANILVDPNGRIKLADFGMAKHITGQSCPLSFKGSPYWMAPEVIKNSNGCNLAVDIWSLGCTVLEMATSKPPWSQYEGVAAMFKIGNSKELPTLPEHISDEGKDFIMKCLQREPLNRPTAAQLLDHPFVKNAAAPEKSIMAQSQSDPPFTNMNGMGIAQRRNIPNFEPERLAIHSSRVSRSAFQCSDIQIPRIISCPVSPLGSPLLHQRSPQRLNGGRMSPSPISSPRNTSGSSTPISGGAIPFPHFINHSSIYSQVNSASPAPYWDPDAFRGVGSNSNNNNNAFRGDVATQCGNDALGKQAVLANRVAQQLLGDHRHHHHLHDKSIPSLLDFNPCPPPPLAAGRTGGGT
ncbi:unnamed protein product [Cuscuta campestris]|uniref:mitogen-activated protein kinase kinase kinase n=2 Tax=Cuscuta sect. Cleistogrammica TaxID=1824901 RepID=A0A484L990_9ASTE|nr:hypothetical protein DM860_010926 [Cuscuta australis]VFQ72698.1 unnamed protein product [Cuscuta campestris]